MRCGEGDVYRGGRRRKHDARALLAAQEPDRLWPVGQRHRLRHHAGLALSQPRMEAHLPAGSHGRDGREHLRTSRAGEIAGGEITREEQDRFALQSQQRAVDAINAGRFQREIVPVTIPQGKREPLVVDIDEYPRYKKTATGYELATSMEQLAALKPAFRQGGTVTAGNASGLNDGAAALVLMSQREGRSAGHQAAGALGGLGRGGRRPARDGAGAGRGDAQGAGACRAGAGGHRPGRAQRSLCRAGAGRAARAGAERGHHQRQRRRHRAGPPARLLGRAHPDHAASTRCSAAPMPANPCATAWRRSVSASARAKRRSSSWKSKFDAEARRAPRFAESREELVLLLFSLFLPLHLCASASKWLP